MMSEVKFKIIKKHVFCDLDDTVTDQLILSTSKSNYTLEHATTNLATRQAESGARMPLESRLLHRGARC